MMSLFKLKPKRIVTLDIGGHSIKLAEFISKKKQVVLENFAFLPVPKDCIVHGDLVQPDLLQEVFTKFIQENTRDVFRLYMGISGRAVIIKKIEIPRVEQEMIEELVEVEVRQNFPINVEDINYNYEIMKHLPATQEDKMSVLLVATKKDIVSHCDQLVKTAGYDCERIDVGGFALAKCMEFMGLDIHKDNKNVLVLDIAKSGTVFVVLHAGDLIFERYIPIGSDFFNTSLTKEMNIEYAEAESLKLSFGEEVPEEVHRIITASSEYLCNEIFASLEYFKNQFPEQELTECYITGGGSQLMGLVGDLEKRFSIPVHALEPLSFIECNDLVQDSLKNTQGFLALSIGLYLRGMQ